MVPARGSRWKESRATDAANARSASRVALAAIFLLLAGVAGGAAAPARAEAPAPRLEPPEGEFRRPADPIVFYVPPEIPVETLRNLALELDNLDVTRLISREGNYAILAPPSPIRPGEHVLRLVESRPDGTIVGYDPESRTTTVVRPDGSASSFSTGGGGAPDPFVRDAEGNPVSTPGGYAAGGPSPAPGAGPEYDSEKDVFVYPDGTRVRGSDPSGSRGKVNEKGDIEYSDGTMVHHDPERGTTSTLHPDGSSTVHDHRSGVSVEFGARDSTYEEGAPKDEGGASSADSSGGSSGSSSGGGGTGSGTGSGSGSSGESETASSDDDDDSDDSSSSSDEGGDSDSDSGSDTADSAGGEDEGGGEEGGGDEYTGFGAGTGGGFRGGTDDPVARRLEEMRDGRAGGDGGDGGSDCGPRSQPGPDGRCAEDPEPPRPSAEDDEPPATFATGEAVAPSGPGGPGDCFDPAGCDEGLGVRAYNPFDRMPVVNPNPAN